MRSLAFLVLCVAGSVSFAQAPMPQPDPGFGGPGPGPGPGSGQSSPPASGTSNDCCKAPLVQWSGKNLYFSHKHTSEIRRIDVVKDVPEWTDLWSGDDECYQKAQTSPLGINLLQDPTDPVSLFALAEQSFEMVDWSIFTEEVGFPADHVHPLAEISGYLQWGYPFKPMPGEKLPGIRLSATVFATSAVKSSGSHSRSGTSASSGTASASVEWRHPCACRNPLVDGHGGTGPFFIDNRVAEGQCELVTETSETVKAGFNGKSAARSRSGEEPEYEGEIGVAADWEKRVSVLMEGTTYIVSHEVPSSSRDLQAETGDDQLRMPFRCFASVVQHGTADAGWVSAAVATGQTRAWAGINVGNIIITPLVGSALPGGL